MRVVIVEDNVILAEGLGLVLASSGFEVVATAADADTFLAAVAEHRPDVCIVDVRLPPGYRDEGIHAAIAARRLIPGLPVLVFSQYVEETYATELLSDGSGGIGYLLKDRIARVAEFITALRRVASGELAIDPEVISQLLAKKHDPLERLTPRELEALGLMAEGHDNPTIAERMQITERAVHKHVGNIFDKLGLPPDSRGHRRVLAVLSYLRR
jgi:DNA-binding NarL/FixJ family response regulator